MVAKLNHQEIVITKPDVTVTSTENEGEPHSRDTWSNQCEFFLSCLGFAVGFGNVWRFPFLTFKNGGAVFLIPYFTMLLIAGLPMFFMELALGQYVSLGPNILFPELAPIFSGVGWAMLATTAMVAIYYNMVFAWALFYTFASFTSELPWSSCNNTFNSDNCFTYQESMTCQELDMYYFNKTCMDIIDFCALSEMNSYNSTHCILDTNETTIKVAEKAVVRMSASEDYYKNRMLGVSGKTWEDMGGLRWELVGCLALAWIIICGCMIKGVKSSGKVVYFSALFPYAVLLILFIRGITLEGSMKGIEFYIMKPDFSKLKDIQVWNDAATQIFYSLSTAFGGLITLSSYNKFKNNCMRDAIIISFANCLTSVFAGFVIFSILGFMANEVNVDVRDVVDSGSGLAFIAYPAAVARMPAPPVWSILFFTMLITLGIDSQFTFVETLSTGLFDRFEHLRAKKSQVMILLCIVMFLLGLPLCLDGGIFLFELINYYSAGISVLFIAICEVMCVVYVYGFDKFMRNIKVDMEINVYKPLYCYWYATWKFLTPASLVVIFAMGIYYFAPGRWGSYIYPENIQVLGWFMTVFSMISIPLYAIYVIWRGPRGLALFRATKKFCPAHMRKRLDLVQKTTVEGAFSYIYDNEGFIDGHVQVHPPNCLATITQADGTCKSSSVQSNGDLSKCHADDLSLPEHDDSNDYTFSSKDNFTPSCSPDLDSSPTAETSNSSDISTDTKTSSDSPPNYNECV